MKVEESTVLDWTEFEELQPLKVGTVHKAKINSIKQGKLTDFLEISIAQKWGDTEQIVLRVEYSTEHGYKNNKLFGLPTNKKISPNSNLAKFKKTYGKYPEENMEVNVKVNDNGVISLIM